MSKSKRNSKKRMNKMIGCSMMGGDGAAEYGGKVYGGINDQHAVQGNLIAMNGGNGAAEYGVNVYGGPGQQHAGQGNLIAMNSTQSNILQGGSKPQNGGNTVIGELLLPAGMLIASQYASRRSKKRGGRKSGRKSRRNRRSRRRP